MTWAPIGVQSVPFHPCGMVMDWLRSAYTTHMRLWAGSDVETPVRWFRAAPGAKVFTGRCSFRSRENEVGNKLWPLGESRSNTTWDAGRPPAVLPGQKHCGEPALFRTGGVLGETEPIVTDARGIAPCCEEVRLAGAGGVVIGGTSYPLVGVVHGAGVIPIGGDAIVYPPPPPGVAGDGGPAVAGQGYVWSPVPPGLNEAGGLVVAGDTLEYPPPPPGVSEAGGPAVAGDAEVLVLPPAGGFSEIASGGILVGGRQTQEEETDGGGLVVAAEQQGEEDWEPGGAAPSGDEE